MTREPGGLPTEIADYRLAENNIRRIGGGDFRSTRSVLLLEHHRFHRRLGARPSARSLETNLEPPPPPLLVVSIAVLDPLTTRAECESAFGRGQAPVDEGQQTRNAAAYFAVNVILNLRR